MCRKFLYNYRYMDDVSEYTLKVMNKAGWYNSWLLSFIKDYLGGSILEVGAGIGNFSKLLENYGELTAIEINKKYLSKYKIRGINFGYGDIERGKYFFKQKQFDAIVCFNVLEHIKDDGKAMNNIYKLLKEGGKAIILVPAHDLLFSDYDRLLGHFRRYDLAKANKLVKDRKFKIRDVRYLNWWSFFGWYIFIKLLKRTHFPQREVGIFNFFGKMLLWPEKIFKLPFGLSVLIIAEK